MANNKKRYIERYNKEKYQMYQFRVKKTDSDIIKKLNSVVSRNQYINALIANDINTSVLTIKQIKDKIKPVIQKYNITEVYLFGSYARGEATRSSDVDIYCDKGNIRDMYSLIDFQEELKAALGKSVDVVTIGSKMDDYFRSQLEEDKIKIC
ncbi:MAG: hypothetical protein E7338_05315 [Clostridiales bacterium]|nr:hypothetical protein [Clostridiales bacterium]